MFSLASNEGALPVARISAAILIGWLVMLLPSSAAPAGPQQYCLAFASNAANNKTGRFTDAGTPADRTWRDAYSKAYRMCMEKYGPQQVKASAAQALKSQRPRLGRNSQRAKASRLATKHHKASTGQQNEKPSYRVKPHMPQASTKAPEGHGRSFCRRVQGDKSGGYQIDNCGDRTR